jgi:hypothetical protein
MRKYSMTLVFSSLSNFYHVSARITFSNCGSQLSKIWHRCQKSSFWNLLGEFKDGHRHGVPTAWGNVYPTPVSAPFARWCRSTARTCHVRFPSLDMLIGILSLPTHEFLHITEPLIKSLHEVVLLWPISLPRNSEWKFSTISRVFLLQWNCGSKLIKSYLDTSHFEPWWFITWVSPSEVVCRYCAFLLKLLKFDSSALLHLLAPYHVHHDYTIT